MGTNAIRFTGLASGLDTESIVSSMILPQKTKVDTSEQKKLLMELQKDKEKEISNRLNKFMMDYSAKLRFSSGFAKLATTSSNSALNVTSATKSGEFEVSDIKVAKNAKLSTESIGEAGTTKLSALGIDTSGTIIRVSDSVGSDGKPVTKDITLKEGMTLSDLAKSIQNELKNSNVSYDENAKGFFISSKDTGKSSFVEIQAISLTTEADGSTTEKIDSGVTDKLGLLTTKADGSNATFNFDGMKITSESNNVTINGVGLELKDDVTGSVRVGATQDKEAIFNNVKDFITEYNKLVQDLNNMVDASANRTYKPLLEEQKSEMSESEIEAWNKKIEDSLFAGNDTIKKVLSEMKDSLSGSFGGITLRDLGIESSSWKDKGVLTINEDKLRSAIDSNTDKVVELFSGDGTLDGLADKMYSNLSSKFKNLSGVKTASCVFNDTLLNSKITEQNKETAKLKERQEKLEEMYYAKFTAMEKMLSQLNSQSTYLSGLLGS